MNSLLFVLGLVLIGATLLDALWTTVAAAGGGPLTTRLARGLWSLVLAGHRRSENHRLLAIMGPLILMSAIVLWILMLWGGYMLVFSAEHEAIVHATTKAPADFWERLYFTGFTVSTLGDSLTQLVPMIELHGQRHLAYPVLHFFHSRHMRTAIAPRLAALDEALFVISVDAKRRGTSPPVSVQTVQHAIAGILATMNAAFITKASATPPILRIEDLKETTPIKAMQNVMRDASAEADARRRLLLAYILDDGWTWDNVVRAEHDALSGGA